MAIEFINLTSHVKRAFEDGMRILFSSDSTPAAYKWDKDISKSQIAIYREFPREMAKYPAIMIQAAAADAKISSLHAQEQKQVSDKDGNPIGVKIGGPLTMPVRLVVMAQTQDDREKLVDMVIWYAELLGRNVLARYEIAYIGIDTEGEGQEIGPDGEIIFSNTVVVSCYTEYSSFLSWETFKKIRELQITGTETSTGDEIISTEVSNGESN
jgi:hypothetical protein